MAVRIFKRKPFNYDNKLNTTKGSASLSRTNYQRGIIFLDTFRGWRVHNLRNYLWQFYCNDMRIEILKNQREHFEKACATMSISYEMYTNERGPDWETVILPEMTDKDAWDLCIMFQVEIKEQIIRDLV